MYGEDLPAYLTDRKRRRYFHPELQAELEFGIDQSTGVAATTILENFEIFLEHGARGEDSNQSILDARDKSNQADFPAMAQLAAAVSHEIAWQKALWDGDYSKAFDAARAVLGKLDDSGTPKASSAKGCGSGMWRGGRIAISSVSSTPTSRMCWCNAVCRSALLLPRCFPRQPNGFVASD